MREKRIKEAIARVEAVAAAGLSLTVREASDTSGPEPYTSLTALLVEVGRAAMRKGRVALVHVDEVQNITDERTLSQLLIALGDAITHEEEVAIPGGAHVRRSLPIAVYLTGLPDFEDRAGAHKGATFARRFRTTVLTAIDDEDIRAALQDFVLPGWEVADGSGRTRRIRMDQDAAAAIVDLCRGEPFLFQLAGERAWYAGSGPTITRAEVHAGWRGAEREAAAHVERILERLPPRSVPSWRPWPRCPPRSARSPASRRRWAGRGPRRSAPRRSAWTPCAASSTGGRPTASGIARSRRTSPAPGRASGEAPASR
ncbi:hypothetical protein [Clavibacter tessellarius]|uniref:hypothetical protein n=1 Tax=Clavibacter tessellarius TaxID=31965 RepID=UPI00324878F4